MSGIYWWTTDIGGFRNGDPTTPGFKDLIVRWFQFGAFCPIFRLHGIRGGPIDHDKCAGEALHKQISVDISVLQLLYFVLNAAVGMTGICLL